MRLDEQLTCLGHLNRRQLLQRDLRAVILDLQLLNKRRSRSAGADGGELRLHMEHSFFHLVDGFENRLVGHPSSVPTRCNPVGDSKKKLNWRLG